MTDEEALYKIVEKLAEIDETLSKIVVALEKVMSGAGCCQPQA